MMKNNDLQLDFISLSDEELSNIVGGFANPDNNGQGLENSISGPASNNAGNAIGNSPNVPGNGNNPKSGSGGVANPDHFFNP